MELELFVHRASSREITLVNVSADTSLADALGVADGEIVWLDDGDEPVDHGDACHRIGVASRAHVHIGRCTRLTVSVTFNGDTISDAFTPNARVERVFDWATGKKGFDLSPTDRTEHVLQVCDTTVEPDAGERIESFVGEDCTVCFKLVPKHRFEG